VGGGATDATAAPSFHPSSSDATRGGAIAPSTVASGATYRSLTARASASIVGSKKRIGETARITGKVRAGTSSVDPSTHPRVSLPWNRNRT
jgi:hypothetical protein